MQKTWKRANSFPIFKFNKYGTIVGSNVTKFENTQWALRKLLSKKHRATNKQAEIITANYLLMLDDMLDVCILHEWAAALNRLCDSVIVRENLGVRIALNVWKEKMFFDPTKMDNSKCA